MYILSNDFIRCRKAFMNSTLISHWGVLRVAVKTRGGALREGGHDAPCKISAVDRASAPKNCTMVVCDVNYKNALLIFPK